MAKSNEKCSLENETVLKLVAPFMADWALADLAPVCATSRRLWGLVKDLPVTICYGSIWRTMFVNGNCRVNVEVFESLCLQYPKAAVIDARMPFVFHYTEIRREDHAEILGLMSLALNHQSASSVILELPMDPFALSQSGEHPNVTHLEIHCVAMTNVLSADCIDQFFAQFPNLLSYKSFPDGKCSNDWLLLQALRNRCPKLQTLRCGRVCMNKSLLAKTKTMGQLSAVRELEFEVCDKSSGLSLSLVLSKMPRLQKLQFRICAWSLDGQLDDNMTPHQHLRNLKVLGLVVKGHKYFRKYFEARKALLPNLEVFSYDSGPQYTFEAV